MDFKKKVIIFYDLCIRLIKYHGNIMNSASIAIQTNERGVSFILFHDSKQWLRLSQLF